MNKKFLPGAVVATALLSTAVAAHAGSAKVGELHRETTTPTAALRDEAHRPAMDMTVWYPAVADAIEKPLEIGEPGNPLFIAGSAAAGVPFAGKRYPVILLSHGFGGSARIMSWFGTEMARSGYVVIAVDHPGNNGRSRITTEGASLWWERPKDLQLALAEAAKDPVIGPHMDMGRVGVAGFSMGGFTALVAAGARIDLARFDRFCKEQPDEATCSPQPEAPDMAGRDRAKAFTTPEMAALQKLAGDDHSIPEVRAAFALAPGIGPSFDLASLRRMNAPVDIMLGAADTIAPPASNGLVAAKAIPHTTLQVLPKVGHYDFLADCTDAGRAQLKQLCTETVPRDQTHRQALDAARAFFAKTLAVR
jgi:predicted dienelactone hydrolase